jgi:hypothetical protein
LYEKLRRLFDGDTLSHHNLQDCSTVDLTGIFIDGSSKRTVNKENLHQINVSLFTADNSGKLLIQASYNRRDESCPWLVGGEKDGVV